MGCPQRQPPLFSVLPPCLAGCAIRWGSCSLQLLLPCNLGKAAVSSLMLVAHGARPPHRPPTCSDGPSISFPTPALAAMTVGRPTVRSGPTMKAATPSTPARPTAAPTPSTRSRQGRACGCGLCTTMTGRSRTSSASKQVWSIIIARSTGAQLLELQFPHCSAVWYKTPQIFSGLTQPFKMLN